MSFRQSETATALSLTQIHVAVECTLEGHKLRDPSATRPEAFQLGREIALVRASSYYDCPDGAHMFCTPSGQKSLQNKRLLPAVTLGLKPISHRHLREMQPCTVCHDYSSKA